MSETTRTVSQQIAAAASQFHFEQTGHIPKNVTVTLGDKTVVVTLHEALSPAERALAASAEGARNVAEYHRQLFKASSLAMREAIQRITGVGVREALVELETEPGAIVHTFSEGTVVQVYLLATPLDGHPAKAAGAKPAGS